MLKSYLKSALVPLGFMALRAGFRSPDRALMRRFFELGYLLDVIRRLRVNCVLDVGAHKGFYASDLRRAGYGGYILSFEPVREDFENLSRLTERDSLWQVLNLALGSGNGRGDLHVADITDLSSFLASNIALQKTETVEVKRLDHILGDILSQAGIEDPRIFLKIDTQGYDLEVVKGAAGILDKVVGLQSEISVTPIYINMPHYTQSLDYYESLGFSLLNLFIVNRTHEGGILEYDCIMAKSRELCR